MSGVCPFAKSLLIPPGSNDPRITPRVAILHVDAGNAHSLYEFFRDRSGGIESHFHVRADGVIEQYRDIYYQADANHHANDFAVSIETQGLGAGEWNDAQLASIKRLLTWLNAEAGIPLRECPTWDGSGVGYHVQFGSPGYWTPVAKSCPGPDRIKQFHTVLVPWMSDPEEDIMATKEELAELLDRKIGPVERQSKKNGRLTYNRDQKIMEAVAALADAVADTATKAQVRRLAKEVAALSDDQEGA